jgi:uncharacterized protein YndB with AHSA1/START domain
MALAGSTDRIEKQVVLRAPRPRAWRALADAREFGAWFGVDLGDAAFAPGAHIRGHVTTPGYEHVPMEVWIERMERDRLFSFRWHPYAVDPATDYSKEPTTLVVFELRDVPEGTSLTVVESGFDRIPVERRAEALRANEGGWSEQVRNIDRHVGRS